MSAFYDIVQLSDFYLENYPDEIRILDFLLGCLVSMTLIVLWKLLMKFLPKVRKNP